MTACLTAQEVALDDEVFEARHSAGERSRPITWISSTVLALCQRPRRVALSFFMRFRTTENRCRLCVDWRRKRREPASTRRTRLSTLLFFRHTSLLCLAFGRCRWMTA